MHHLISTNTERLEATWRTRTPEADFMQIEEALTRDQHSLTQTRNHSIQEVDINPECQEDHTCQLPELVEPSATLVGTQTTNPASALSNEDARITEEHNFRSHGFQKTNKATLKSQNSIECHHQRAETNSFAICQD